MKLFIEYFTPRSSMISNRLSEIKSPIKFTHVIADSTGRIGYGILECENSTEMKKSMTNLVDLIIKKMNKKDFTDKIKETYSSNIIGPTDVITGESINIYKTRDLDDILERIFGEKQ